MIAGVKNLLCAQGRVEQTQLHIFLQHILRSKIQNLAAAKARAGRESPSPETPFLPALPSLFRRRQISCQQSWHAVFVILTYYQNLFQQKFLIYSQTKHAFSKHQRQLLVFRAFHLDRCQQHGFFLHIA